MSSRIDSSRRQEQIQQGKESRVQERPAELLQAVRISRQYLSSALVHGRGIVFRHYYRSLAKSNGKDFRDGAVVPYE
jgi:hypothetical protein